MPIITVNASLTKAVTVQDLTGGMHNLKMKSRKSLISPEKKKKKNPHTIIMWNMIWLWHNILADIWCLRLFRTCAHRNIVISLVASSQEPLLFRYFEMYV